MSVIAVFVGGFLVFLTFSVAVAERTPTYGILRALGARPAQVRRVVLTEAGVLGLRRERRRDRRRAGHRRRERRADRVAARARPAVARDARSPRPSSAWPSACGVSLAAAWLPGRRASALGPVEAMRDGATGIERTGRWRPRALLLVLGIAVGVSGTERRVRGRGRADRPARRRAPRPVRPAAGRPGSSAARPRAWLGAPGRSPCCTW